MDKGTPVNILLVEDNPGDVWLIRETLKERNFIQTVHVVSDGEDAVQFLDKKGRFLEAPTPDLVLLDLNLPKKNGKEVLHFIRSTGALKSLPVVVLTTSAAESDIMDSYRDEVNCFVTKPVNLSEFTKVIQSIQDFWYNIVLK